MVKMINFMLCVFFFFLTQFNNNNKKEEHGNQRGLRLGEAGVGSYKGKDLSFIVRVLFVGMGVCVLTVGVPTRTPEEGSSH